MKSTLPGRGLYMAGMATPLLPVLNDAAHSTLSPVLHGAWCRSLLAFTGVYLFVGLSSDYFHQDMFRIATDFNGNIHSLPRYSGSPTVRLTRESFLW